jgi:hypothetical protein
MWSRSSRPALRCTVCMGMILVCLSGCSAKDSSRGSSFGTVAASASTGAFSYSFAYVAPPPEGRRIEFMFVDRASKTCGLFSGGEATPTDFDGIKVRLSGTELTDYAVDPTGDLVSERKASVEWIVVRSGTVQGKAFAASGTVSYTAGPTSEETWPTVTTARLDVVANIELNPVTSSECNGGMDMRTGEQSTSCTCRRQSGSVFHCDGSSGGCCHDVFDRTEEIHLTVEGSACAEQCNFTQPELARYCRALQ